MAIWGLYEMFSLNLDTHFGLTTDDIRGITGELVQLLYAD